MPSNREPVGQIGSIMRADYGDLGQAAVNAVRVNPARSEQVLHHYRNRKEGIAQDKVRAVSRCHETSRTDKGQCKLLANVRTPAGPRGQSNLQIPLAPQQRGSNHPPAWDTHVFGPAFGNCNRGPSPVAPQRHRNIHVGNGALFPLPQQSHSKSPKRPYEQAVLGNAHDISKLEEVNSPGLGFHRMPCSAPRWQLDRACCVQAMRAVLKRRASVHIIEKTLLLSAFARVLKKRQVETKDTVRIAQFQAVWKAFGVAVDDDEAIAIFNKYGQVRLRAPDISLARQDTPGLGLRWCKVLTPTGLSGGVVQNTLGHMPITVFVSALLMGGNRALLSGDSAFMQGPLSPSCASLPLDGKIMYPQSKKGVFAPSNWSPATAARSFALPEKRLQLSFVFGYEGKATTSSNMCFNAHGEVVYFVAAVGVVYDRTAHQQRVFLGHNDDIVSLAMHPGKQLAATGQVRFASAT